MNKQEKKERIKRLFWDLSVDVDRIVRYMDGDTESLEEISVESLYRRMLTSVSWYTLQELVSREMLRDMLDDRILSRLFPKDLKEQYTYAREVLSR